VAADTSDPQLIYELVRRALDGEITLFPLDHRMPAGEARELVRRVRPTQWADGRAIAGGLGAADDVALVVATSATTGAAKAVELSARALASSARGFAAATGSLPEDRWLSCLPLSRIAGLSTMVRSILAGTHPETVLPFDAALVAKGEAQLISLVPAMLHRLLQLGWDPSPYRAILLGGGPIPNEMVREAKERGGNIVATYGLTETCGGCVYDGAPLGGVEVDIDATSQILVKGNVVMNGYRLDPQISAARLQDGWLRTGDLGSLQGGILVVNGRMDDVIITGGEKVSPVMVEQVLAQIEGVVDALLTSVPDAEWGRKTIALVVRSGSLDEQKVRAAAKERLAASSVPSHVFFVESLPKTAAGKADRLAAQGVAASLHAATSREQKAHTDASSGIEDKQ